MAKKLNTIFICLNKSIICAVKKPKWCSLYVVCYSNFSLFLYMLSKLTKTNMEKWLLQYLHDVWLNCLLLVEQGHDGYFRVDVTSLGIHSHFSTSISQSSALVLEGSSAKRDAEQSVRSSIRSLPPCLPPTDIKKEKEILFKKAFMPSRFMQSSEYSIQNTFSEKKRLIYLSKIPVWQEFIGIQELACWPGCDTPGY